MIRNVMVRMRISSEICHSYVNENVWNRFGRPKLQPTDDYYSKGYFVANIHFAGRVYQLPLMVWKQNYRPNILGRSWFPAFHLNWNGIFHCNEGASQFQPESAKQRQLALEMADNFPECFRVKVNVDGVDIQMSLDTGNVASRISLAEWERIGKPPLHQTPNVFDFTDTWVIIEGECNVQVEYNGQSAFLPVAVMSEGCESSIGVDWFNLIQFDFNTIFDNIEFRAK